MIAPINGPIGRRIPPTTAMMRMSITGPTPAVPGEICPPCQTSSMPRDGGDQRRERVGRDAMRGDVEAERRHAARVVAHALQREPERRARDVDDGADRQTTAQSRMR